MDSSISGIMPNQQMYGFSPQDIDKYGYMKPEQYQQERPNIQLVPMDVGSGGSNSITPLNPQNNQNNPAPTDLFSRDSQKNAGGSNPYAMPRQQGKSGGGGGSSLGGILSLVEMFL